jgi:cytochrome oxidase assembly protein ShyY1
MDLPAMWNRQATAVGQYDLAGQLLVRSQNYEGQPGVYLLAPLVLEGEGTAVLVHRGWLPSAEAANAANYHQTGVVSVTGRIQLSEGLSGGRVTEITADNELFRIDVPAIADHLGYPILPVYLLEEPPPPPDRELPYQLTADLTLDEGDHLSYAFQWFIFAAMLAGIYTYLVAKSL